MTRASSLALALTLAACATKASSAEPDARPAEPVVFVESPTDPSAARAPNPSEGVSEGGAADGATDDGEPNERDRAEAKRLYAEGLHFYEQADYAEALARWQLAYALVRMPQLAYNIAKCYEQLGRVQDACATYRELYADPDAELEKVANDSLTRLGC